MTESELTFLGKIVFPFYRPKEFFELIEAEGNIWTSFLFLALLLIIVMPLQYLVLGLVDGFSLGILPEIIANTSFGLLLMLAMLPIYVLSAYVFGARKGAKKSVQAFVYGATPTIVVSWIPILPLFVGLYSIWLSIIGLKTLQDISTVRAALAYVVPLAILGIAIILT